MLLFEQNFLLVELLASFKFLQLLLFLAVLDADPDDVADIEHYEHAEDYKSGNLDHSLLIFVKAGNVEQRQENRSEVHETFTPDFNDLLLSCFVSIRIVDQNTDVHDSQHMMGNHLHMWIVKKVDCDQSKQASSPEKCNWVDVSSLVSRGHIQTSVNRSDLLDFVLARKCVLVHFQSEVIHNRSAIKDSKYAGRDDDILNAF